MTDPTPTLTNPYIGPRSFRRNEVLYGRARERRDLLAQLIAERIVLLHSPSGAGKTSLIEAALIPDLIAARFQVLPVIRVNHAPPAGGPAVNRFLYSTLYSLDQQLSAEQLLSLDLATYLRTFVRPASPDEPLLIFDQFEEVLTLAPTEIRAKQEFFAGLAAALADRHIWALFAMREDYVAALEPYVRPFPNRLKDQFRLDLLGVAAARQAIQGPAKSMGVTFTDEAANALIDDLRRMRVELPDGSSGELPGPHVEPVQLQVACLRLWNRHFSDPAAAGRLTITPEDLERVGDVDAALADYYAECVARIAARHQLRERAIREWFDRRLITADGRRGQVIRQQGQSDGLANEAIGDLINAYMVRAEERRGNTWYELAHDRLLSPIQANNREWFRQNLSPLQRAADQWEREDRPDRLLFRDADLRDAEAWALRTPAEVGPVEEAFLAESRKEQVARDREARRNRQIRWLNAGLLVLVLFLIGLALYTFSLYQRAQAEAHNALVRQYAAQAVRDREQSPQRSLLLAVEAFDRADPRDPSAPAAEEGLREVLAVVGGEPLRGHQGPLRRVLFAPDGRLISAGDDGAVRVWPRDPAAGPAQPLHGHTGPVTLMALSQDGRWLATGSKDASVRLWRMGAEVRPVGELRRSFAEVTALAFSPDNRTLASAGFDGVVRLWDAATPEAAPLELPGHSQIVYALAFSPDGELLASASDDATILLWDLRRAREPRLLTALEGHTRGVVALAFSPDGRLLASAGNDATVRLWRMGERPALQETLTGHGAAVVALAFSPDGRTLASGSLDTTARLWRMGERVETVAELRGHTGSVGRLLFSADGGWLATGSADGTARLWRVDAPTSLPFVLRGHVAEVTALAFSADGGWLATGSADGTARLWQIRAPVSAPIALRDQRAAIKQAAFSPDGRWLAAIDSESAQPLVRLWRADDLTAPPSELAGPQILLSALAVSDRSGLIAAGDFDGLIWFWRLDDPDDEPISRRADNLPIGALAFSPDGSRIASADFAGAVRLWPLPAPQVAPAPLQGVEHPVVGLAFSPDGRWLAARGTGSRAWLWRLDQGPGAALVLSHPDTANVLSMAFSPDGRWLATGGSDGEARLWPLDAADPSARTLPLAGHARHVYDLAFSPDSRLLATGSWDGTVRLWQVGAAPRQLAALSGQGAEVYAVAFSPDGARLAAASIDGNVRLWQVAMPEQEPVLLRGHEQAVKLLAFSPDGRWLASGSDDQTVRLWPLRGDELRQLACAAAGRNMTLEEAERYRGQDVDTYTKVCAEFPGHESRYLALLRAGRIDRALEIYAADLPAAPGREPPAAWLVRLAAAIVDVQHMEQVLAIYRRALEIDPELAGAQAASFNALCRYAWPENVRTLIDACNKAVERAPDNGNYKYNRGARLAMLGDRAGAIRDFRDFILWAPGRRDADDAVSRVEGWIAELESGGDPFGLAPPPEQ